MRRDQVYLQAEKKIREILKSGATELDRSRARPQPRHGLQQLYEAQWLRRFLDRRPLIEGWLYKALLFRDSCHRLPQDAMNQWRIEKNDWSAVLNSRVTEIGVGYVFSKFSAYGGYWTMDLGGP
jgi:hypothetical protein